MPRMPRIYVEHTLLYVTSRAVHGQKIFPNPSDTKEFLRIIHKYKEQFGFKLFAYALLPDHFHLLIELRNNVTISTIMHAINSLYIKSYNARYGKKGHVLQSRFRCVIADKETHLLRLTTHIHSNPRRTKLVESPKQYAYTSYAQYLGKEDPMLNIRQEVLEVLSLIPEENTVEGYEFLMNSIPRNDEAHLHDLVSKKMIIGPKIFTASLRDRIKKSASSTSANSREEPKPAPRILVGRPVMVAVGLAAIVILSSVGVNYLFMSIFSKRYLTPPPMISKMAPVEDVEALRLAESSLEAESIANIVLAEPLQIVPQQIDGSIWDIVLTELHPARNVTRAVIKDRLKFKNSVVISTSLASNGFGPTRYTVQKRGPNLVVWETIQKSKNGGVVRWYGEWDGTTIKGFMTQHGREGLSREFTFTGTPVNRQLTKGKENEKNILDDDVIRNGA